MYFNSEHDVLRQTVRRFVDKEINPYMDEWEECGKMPLHDIFRKMGNSGY